MNSMIPFKPSQLFFCLILCVLSVLSISCEDKAAIAEEARLSEKIESLEAELKEAKAALPEDPGSQSQALSAVDQELDKAKKVLKLAKEDKEKLKRDLQNLENEFLKYKESYQIN